MVNSLQLKELGVENTTAVYPWFGKYVIQLFTEFTNKSTWVLTCGNKNNKIALPKIH